MSRKKIFVTESFLPPLEEYHSKLEEIWQSKILTNRGPFVLELEDQIKNHLGSKSKPLAVNNGTIAIQLAIKALNLSGEIITTPFSYIATTSSVVWENCTPVFVDIDPDYLTIDEKRIEEAITNKTTAIIATHVFGNPCNVDVIKTIADKHGLKVIYDAAHCFDVSYNGNSLFDFGDISTCSFHATKLFHTGEGGAVFCNNNQVEKDLFLAHNFGHDGPGQITGVGINGKLSDIQAAIGLCVLPYMNEIISKRKEAYNEYNRLLSFNRFRGLKIRKGCDWNYSYLPIIFNSEEELLSTIDTLNEKEVYPRRYFYPSLNKIEIVNGKSCPNSESVSSRILCLPLSHSISKDDIKIISDLVNLEVSQ